MISSGARSSYLKSSSVGGADATRAPAFAIAIRPHPGSSYSTCLLVSWTAKAGWQLAQLVGGEPSEYYAVLEKTG
jgi:hypothetical protein